MICSGGGSTPPDREFSLEKPKSFNPATNYPEWPWSTISDIAVDPSNSQIVYASDLMFGMYRSTDGGTNWVQINEGLTMREVSSLALSDDGNILYAGTRGGGVFRLVLINYAPEILSTSPDPDSTISITKGDSLEFKIFTYDLNADTLSYSWVLDDQLLEGSTGDSYLLRTTDLVVGNHSLTVEVADADTSVSLTWDIDVIAPGIVDNEELPNIPETFALMQNHPNPFNPVTKISYDLPADCDVKLTIYNLLGQKVKVLVGRHQTAGCKHIYWDGKDDWGKEVGSGAYFYRIQAGDFVQTKKMVLVK
ncbi:MAG: FlgD immunoglobulin-like domain containing protein [Candidatus Zixiibacteriota bacterium]